MHEQRNAQGVHSSQQKKAFPTEWILSLGLIYAGMREKTHSASTQLKGTEDLEQRRPVTDLINLLEVWETSPSESWGDQQSRKAEEGVSTWMDSEPWTDLCKLHLAS